MRSIKAIEYDFKGDDMQLVEITLEQGDRVVGDTKDMMYMEQGINLEILSNKSSKNKGRFQKMVNGSEHISPSEVNHMTEFINDDFVQRKIAFGSPYIGKIIPIILDDKYLNIYCLSQAFLCAAKGAAIHIEHQRKSDVLCQKCNSLEMNRISGEGTVFLSSNGTVLKRELEEREMLRVDVGCLLAMSHHVQYDYQSIGNDAEESCVCLVAISGPGTIWLQSAGFH